MVRTALLQIVVVDILKTCEQYAEEHNLKFSTDPNPKKCKTKCMAFLHKPRVIPSVLLCGNPLPWVDSMKHLGNTVSNKIDGGQLDMKQKIAIYIDKNCHLNQEFYFAHPVTKITVNTIYNGHFSGSQIWNLFSKGSQNFESTYNRSVKIMADLPVETHRFLIEPISGAVHLKKKLIRNFLGFISKVKNSVKPVLRELYNLAKADVRTTTGCNLRNILLLTNKLQIDDLDLRVAEKIDYHLIDDKDEWRIPVVKELMEIKHGSILPPEGWTKEELDVILKHVCTQ